MLTNCSHCKKEISFNANTCPHCGAATKSAIIGRWILIGVGLIIAALYLMGEAHKDQVRHEYEMDRLGEQMRHVQSMPR